MEISVIADALYEKLPEAEKRKVIDKFRSMDENGDGKITLGEYIRFLNKQGNTFNPELFTLFDRDQDGCLDFNELKTLHYMYSTKRLVRCEGAGCGAYVAGDYFSCSLCFHTDKPYNLCFCCYKERDIESMHWHSADSFLDNHTLLQFSRSRVLEMQRAKQQSEYASQLIEYPAGQQQEETICQALLGKKKRIIGYSQWVFNWKQYFNHVCHNVGLAHSHPLIIQFSVY